MGAIPIVVLLLFPDPTVVLLLLFNTLDFNTVKALKPFTPAGDLRSGTVHAVYPPSGHCASPRGPPGPPPGSLGPPARPLQSPQWDLRPTSNFSHSAGLQPAGLRKARKKHTKTLNIDLSFSDRAPNGLVRSHSLRLYLYIYVRQVDRYFG